jgi:ABC-type nitrate/sulfonate/bicarbonate transport system substrate-binding protein
MATIIRLALDWFPNPIHAGFLIAQSKNWYQQRGIELIMNTPTEDNYLLSTAEKLIQAKADLAIMPPEALINEHHKGCAEFVAIATLLQNNTSLLAAQPNLSSKKEIRYAPLDIPYEEAVIKQIAHKYLDGKALRFIKSPRLDSWQLFLKNEADLCWIFNVWESIEAAALHKTFKSFSLEQAGIPYMSCPLLVANSEWLQANQPAVQTLLEISASAYYFAFDYPQEALKLVLSYMPEHYQTQQSMVFKSLIEVNKNSMNPDGVWGAMKETALLAYLRWLQQKQLVSSHIGVKALFDNQYLSM